MNKSSFTEAKILSILKEAEAGAKVSEICRKYEISDATFYNWKENYGKMNASDVRRLKEMEQELNQLKRLYAEVALENRALKGLLERKR